VGKAKAVWSSLLHHQQREGEETEPLDREAGTNSSYPPLLRDSQKHPPLLNTR
jgi:hypothetical protein